MASFRHVLLALALMMGASPAAWGQVDPLPPVVNWTNSFFVQAQGGGSGFENPIVRFGFNPQPEPPALLNSGLFQPDPQTVRLGRSSEGFLVDSFFDVFFAIGGSRTNLVASFFDIPASGESVKFDITTESGTPAFSLFFDVFTSSGGGGEDWVGLNPQPEVPSVGLFGPQGYGGFSFQFDSFSDLYVSLQIADAEGNLLNITPVPEPEIYAMLGVGLGLMGWAARRRKVKEAA